MRYTLDLSPTIDAAQGTVRIALLGPPLLLLGEQPLALARRQARALLYYIAATPHPIPREQLGFLLWPESSEMTARRNLTMLLAQIRRALPHLGLLVTRDGAIGLEPNSTEIDTAALVTLIPQAINAGQLDWLADALRLYRGPFLDGFVLPDSAEFEAWVSQERWLWEHRYLDALAVLTEGYAAAGQYHAAINAAQTSLATDELAEDVHRQLIGLYAASGNRAAAIRQWVRCVEVLEREMGTSPLPETRAVYEAARDGQAHLAVTWIQRGRDSDRVVSSTAQPGSERSARVHL